MDWQKIDTKKVEEALAAAAPDLEAFRAITAGYWRYLRRALAIPKPDYTTEDFPIFYRFGWGGACAVGAAALGHYLSR